MNLLQRTWAALRALPSPQPVTWETVFGSGRHSLTGVSVTETSSLRHSPVWCGVATLSSDVARIPLGLYKVLPNGGKVPFRAHKLYRILHDDPNPEMTSFKFRETMQALCLLYGNAYAEIVRDELRRPVGMYPLIPTRVTPFRQERTGRLMYRVRNPNGGETILAPENVIHLSSLSFDGIIGESMVSYGANSIALGIAAEEFGSAFFGNGATFGGVAQYDQMLTKEQRADIQSAIEAVHQGVDRAHKILVLGGGAKFTQRGTAPNEAQFSEARAFQVREVSRWLKMPPHKLQDYEDAHFTNVEHSEISYWVGCVGAWLKMWEQELARKLIAPLEYGQQSISFNMNAQLRGDSQARGEFYSKMFGIGALSVNDILALEDMNPIGPSGDLHLVPLNMVPLERYNEMIDAQIASKKPVQQISQGTLPDDARYTTLTTEIRELKERAEAHEQRSLEFLTAFKADSLQHAEQLIAASRSERASAEALQAEVAAKQQALDAMTQERNSAVSAAHEAAAARTEYERRAQEAEAQAQEARNEHAQKVKEAQEAADAVAVAVARAVAAEQRGDATEHEKAALQREIDTARAVLIEREQALLSAQQVIEAATRSAEETTEKAAALQAALETQKSADVQRQAKVITAHRALILDAIRRFARVEVERARRRAKSPEELQKWADAFYTETRRDDCAAALKPAVEASLVWRGSDEDPNEVARSLADAYQGDSVQQIRTLCDGMVGEEFQAAVTRMLARWEQERPEMVADKVVRDEIASLVQR